MKADMSHSGSRSSDRREPYMGTAATFSELTSYQYAMQLQQQYAIGVTKFPLNSDCASTSLAAPTALLLEFPPHASCDDVLVDVRLYGGETAKTIHVEVSPVVLVFRVN